MTRFPEGCVVITGGAGGIGSATARLFSEAGKAVAVLDRNGVAAEAVAADLRQSGYKVRGFALDVTDAAACIACAAQVEEAFGPCSVLVNNAGVHLREKVDDADVMERSRRTFDINVWGMVNVTMAMLPHLRRTRGRVVNLASIGSFVTAHTALSYGPSKAAVKLFTQSLAEQLAPDGVAVNAVAPGPVETPMTQATRDNPVASERLAGRTLLKRYALPAEIAHPILFLASEAASYITGTTLAVDGGFLAT